MKTIQYLFEISGFKNSAKGWKRTLIVRHIRGEEEIETRHNVKEHSILKFELTDGDVVQFDKYWMTGAKPDTVVFSPSICDLTDTHKVSLEYQGKITPIIEAR